jgi:hypothetical protein
MSLLLLEGRGDESLFIILALICYLLDHLPVPRPAVLEDAKVVARRRRVDAPEAHQAPEVHPRAPRLLLEGLDVAREAIQKILRQAQKGE